jgi:hypothetical protein
MDVSTHEQQFSPLTLFYTKISSIQAAISTIKEMIKVSFWGFLSRPPRLEAVSNSALPVQGMHANLPLHHDTQLTTTSYR